jgi:hypothetical protein
MAELQELCSVDGTERLPLASAATFSGEEVLSQIDARFAGFNVMEGDNAIGSEARRFLDEEVLSSIDRASINARLRYKEAGLDFSSELPRNQWALSPSDFGFHNALRRVDGRLVFLDFEYFGWDDPAKLVSDFLLHPGMSLSNEMRQQFYKGAQSVFGTGDVRFQTRFEALYPLFGLCWCLITLNEFLPAIWARRSAASGGFNPDLAQTAQLEKARRMLANIEESLENGPDFT